ncbi:DUF1554 domain-containing protein [Leptospira langatensis]|uniref:DUF1554 domain-containing protein n=1 Tax=Leptospira langatensis TaxID=2484983 RepID=A0A5F1ZTX9_9LEPT|nr:DUF1554 domain-containing protein [Leptospira langatensis]TGJ98807.1 DUF1554 domain-containing protein [Leptospira langatensis]TGL40626.1 DUF1554 domain-containing protein [Leptospira langatensis]
MGLRTFSSALLLCSSLVFGSCSIPFPGSDEVILLGLIGKMRYLFVTSTTYTGALGGISGADAKCQSSKDTDAPTLPGLGIEYSAIIAGVGRTPGGAGWPLFAHTKYYTNTPATNTLVFHTSGSALPILPMDSASGIPGAGLNYWTGIADAAFTPSGNAGDCINWSSSLVTDPGDYGASGDPTIGAFNQGFANTCDQLLSLLCVRN